MKQQPQPQLRKVASNSSAAAVNAAVDNVAAAAVNAAAVPAVVRADVVNRIRISARAAMT